MGNIKEILLNAYLDLSREGGDLRDMAYAKAILWVLCAEAGSLSAENIAKDIAELVQQKNIPCSLLEPVLRILRTKKLILEKDGNFLLSPVQREKMERQVKYSIEVTDRIISKRFPSQIDKQTLKAWFEDINTQYFSADANKLIALHSSKQKPVFNVESILKAVAKKHKIQRFEKELLQGYKEFLTSTDREEEEKVFNLLSSILSSRVVAANLSPEILSVEKYKGVEMFLDTNVLFAMALNREEELDKAFNSFSAVSQSLDIKFSLTHFTIEEYERVIGREREVFLALVESYSKKVFAGMSQNSDFAKAILSLGCENAEDIERFFDITLKNPQVVGDKKITTLSKIKGSNYVEELDRALLEKIKAETGKTENTAMHDLRLTKVAIKKRRADQAFILTLDGRMEIFALNQVSDKEEPLWLSLYSFIQILAINGAGPDFNPSDLAPFIKMFVEFEEATNEEKYDNRDLFLLLEKTERVNDLSEMQMISLLNKLHRFRLKRPSAEALREITLEMDRALRQNAITVDAKLKEKQVLIDSLEADKSHMGARLENTSLSLQRQKKKNVYLWFALRALLYLLFGVLVVFLAWSNIVHDYIQKDWFNFVTKLAFCSSSIGFGLTDYFSYTVRQIEKIEKETN